MSVGSCSASEYASLVTILTALGDDNVDAASICNAYNVSAIGVTVAALAATVQEVLEAASNENISAFDTALFTLVASRSAEPDKCSS